MSDDDWMQQLKQRKQQETGPARQQQATTTGYAITFTLPSQGTGMSLPGQETPEFRYRRFVELGRRGLELYEQGRLAEALAAYDEAIRLGESLDLSVAEYRNVLASVYTSKGGALQALDNPQDLVAAIAAFDEAIRLRETLDLSVAEYRRILTYTYIIKGIALQALGTPQDLVAAIAAFDEAIRLGTTFDDLANAHDSKGNALYALGTPQALTEAVATFDEAIRLGTTLDLSVAQYRNNLARAHTGKGNALYALGTPQALTKAIAAFDEAIRLGEPLDLNVAQYRNDLANAHDNKGNALYALGTPQALTEVGAAHDEAIRLRESLDLSVAKYRTSLIGTYVNKGNVLFPRMALDLYQKAIAFAGGGRGLSIIGIEFTAKAYLGAAGAYLRLADPASAADSADDGLSLLRELEIKGVFKLRSLREDLFKATLDAYFQSRQFQRVPDIIRECLDPSQPGSAPASEAMHAAAFNALIKSLTTLYQEPSRAVADELTKLEALAKQLADWRVRYFSGEASSAWLRAQDCEKRGQPEQAEQILHAYIQARPLDPCGPKVLGDLYAQRRQPAAAEAAYRDAVRVCARSTPPKDDLHARSIGVVTLARCLLDLRLLQLSDAAPTTATTPDPIATLGQGYDQLHTLLTGDVVHDLVNHSPPDLKGLWWERLKPELEALWQRAAAQRDDWLTKHTQGLVQKERDQAFEAVLTLTKGLFQGLGRSWQDYQQAMLCALREIWDYQTARSGQPDLEELVATAVREAVERSARALADSELQAPYESLHQALEPLWDRVLEDREKRFLGCGWRGLQYSQDEDMRRFAGLNLGLAVEWSLAHRLYEPLKVYWSQSGKPDLGTHRLAPQIDRFLTRSNQHLMLGEMTGALNSALKHAHKGPDGLRGLIVACLRQMPNASTLLNANESTHAHRRRQLELINACRIDCAHPEPPPSQEQLETLWAAVAADPEHAFFRYFGAALLPPSDRVIST